MVDARFYPAGDPLTLSDLERITGARARSGSRGDRFVAVSALVDAGPEHLVFVEDRRYLDLLGDCGAGACLIHPDAADAAPPGMALLLTRAPQRGFALAAAALHPPPPPNPGVAVGAVVDPTARVATSSEIGPGAVVAARAEIGEGVVLGAHSAVGTGCVIGEGTRIGPSASIANAIIGSGVTIHAGVRIGEDGFGVVPGRDGHLAIPQLGRVVIHDGVNIGANTTIDRGALGDTVIGQGCFVDNLVQIGHNVRLGRGCIIAAQVGISGSTVVGDFVMMGGQSGVTGHLHIGDGARIAAQTGVMRDVAAGQSVGGSPAVPVAEFLRQAVVLRRLAKGKGA